MAGDTGVQAPKSAGGTSGRIELSLRIGVTGHRRLDHETQTTADVRAALIQLATLVRPPSASLTPTTITVVSALAEGADRLVAREVLEDAGARLEVVLPLSVEDYEQDFTAETSRQEFRALLARADSTTVMASSTRDDAYMRAGREIVDRSDVLIAVWDGDETGMQGGTSETVAYARRLGTPVFWVRPMLGGGITEEVGGEERPIESDEVGPLGRDAFARLEEFNRAAVGEADPVQLVDLSLATIGSVASGLGDDQERLARILHWASPYYSRTDELSQRYRRHYARLSGAMFCLAVSAVAAVALQVCFSSLQHWWWLVAIEIGSLVLVFVGLVVGRLLRWHERWISYRSLAEWLRSAVFLTLVGVGVPSEGTQEEVAVALDPSSQWLQRAFREIWLRRPWSPPQEAKAGLLGHFLVEAWIRHQRDYHDAAKDREKRHGHRYRALGWAAFILSVAAAMAHLALSVMDREGGWEELTGFSSILLPVVGAAFGGFAAQREFERHAERYERMIRQLDQQRVRMGRAGSLGEIQRVALDTERVMRAEGTEWFGAVRLHDIELPF